MHLETIRLAQVQGSPMEEISNWLSLASDAARDGLVSGADRAISRARHFAQTARITLSEAQEKQIQQIFITFKTKMVALTIPRRGYRATFTFISPLK